MMEEGAVGKPAKRKELALLPMVGSLTTAQAALAHTVVCLLSSLVI